MGTVKQFKKYNKLVLLNLQLVWFYKLLCKIFDIQIKLRISQMYILTNYNNFLHLTSAKLIRFKSSEQQFKSCIKNHNIITSGQNKNILIMGSLEHMCRVGDFIQLEASMKTFAELSHGFKQAWSYYIYLL